jgi:hypothetical protein
MQVQEHGEGTADEQVAADFREAITRTAQDIEHECAIGDGFAKVCKAEQGIKVESVCLVVPEKLILKSEPVVAGRSTTLHHLGQVRRNGVGYPNLTTQSMRAQSGNCGPKVPSRTWLSSEYLLTTRRK